MSTRPALAGECGIGGATPKLKEESPGAKSSESTLDEMRHSFAGPKAKIARAKKLLGELEAECHAYLAANPPPFSARVVPMPTGQYQIQMKFTVQPVPETISTIVGDVIHNLRSALDLAACDLVAAAHRSSKSVHFPFCDKPDELEDAIKHQHFNRAGPDAIALLKSFKPYKGGNIALRALHDFDVTDKHKALIPAVTSASGPIIRLWDDDGTPIPRVMGDPDKATSARLVFPAGSEFAGKEFVPTLRSFAELAEGIIEAFVVLANR